MSERLTLLTIKMPAILATLAVAACTGESTRDEDGSHLSPLEKRSIAKLSFDGMSLSGDLQPKSHQGLVMADYTADGLEVVTWNSSECHDVPTDMITTKSREILIYYNKVDDENICSESKTSVETNVFELPRSLTRGNPTSIQLTVVSPSLKKLHGKQSVTIPVRLDR